MLEECILSLRLDLIMLRLKFASWLYAYSLWKSIKFSRSFCKNISANKQTGRVKIRNFLAWRDGIELKKGEILFPILIFLQSIFRFIQFVLSWELSRRCSSLWYGWRVLDADGENLHNVHHLSGGNSIFLFFFIRSLQLQLTTRTSKLKPFARVIQLPIASSSTTSGEDEKKFLCSHNEIELYGCLV